MNNEYEKIIKTIESIEIKSTYNECIDITFECNGTKYGVLAQTEKDDFKNLGLFKKASKDITSEMESKSQITFSDTIKDIIETYIEIKLFGCYREIYYDYLNETGYIIEL